VGECASFFPARRGGSGGLIALPTLEEW
jgi:hypothetical protein